jgi:hypothetical protein
MQSFFRAAGHLRGVFARRDVYSRCDSLAAWRLWDYGGAHLFTRVYWTSLTFLDPLAASLLFVRPHAGLVLTVAIITSDVLHNTLVGVPSLNPMYISQIVFLFFVACTVYVAWRGSPSEPRHEATLSV